MELKGGNDYFVLDRVERIRAFADFEPDVVPI